MNATGESLPAGRANTWLLSILGLLDDALFSIRKEVAEMVNRCAAKNKDWSKRKISYEVSSRLIRREALKASGVGGITAAPSLLPGFGTLGAAAAGTAIDIAYLTKKHIDLCYGISAAYEVEMEPERLKAVALALLGFSGGAAVTKHVAARTLRIMVDQAAAGYLKKGLANTATEVAEKIGPRLLGRTYKLIPFLGIPLNASLNAASTILIGKQARKYFSTWHNDVDSMV